MICSRSTSLRSVALSTAMALIAVGTSSTAAFADDRETDEARIKYRQSIMSTVGTNMGAIGDIMKNIRKQILLKMKNLDVLLARARFFFVINRTFLCKLQVTMVILDCFFLWYPKSIL
jgi:hypothetical protein